jgi:hypothetical protein
MNKILNYSQFLNESYLKGSRQPLYHYTSNLFDKFFGTGIISSDMLKVSGTADDTNAICATRNIDYKFDNIGYKAPHLYRIVLDQDKLLLDGIKFKPIDEIKGKLGGKGNVNTHHNKSVSRRPNNKVYTDNDRYNMEFEFEERYYRNIPNLGKYLISIDISSDKNLTDNEIDKLKEYVAKYPHISLNSFDPENLHVTKDITYKIKDTIHHYHK